MTNSSPLGRRWFHITPGWLIVGLLIAEILLCLSGRYTWFSFNGHKGWTALFGTLLAIVVVTILGLWFAASFFFRRRFQFSLRSLLAFVPAIAIPLGMMAPALKSAQEQEKAVEAIRSAGEISYEWEDQIALDKLERFGMGGMGWATGLLGNDFFMRQPV